MTTAKYELDLRPALFQYKVEQLSISQFALLVAQRLNELLRWTKVIGEEGDVQAVEALWARFDFIGGDASATVEELDEALEELYDWADTSTSLDEQGRPMRGEILCRVRNDPKS